MIVLFKQKTAYEMRISDWSSDVCSSDLLTHPEEDQGVDKPKEHRRAEDRFPRVAVAEGRKEITERAKDQHGIGNVAEPGAKPVAPGAVETNEVAETGDRKSAEKGKSVSVRVDLGGRRIITNKNKN